MVLQISKASSEMLCGLQARRRVHGQSCDSVQSRHTIQSFRARSRPTVSNNIDIPPTELSHMRHKLERANSTRLTVLQTLPFYHARDPGSATPNTEQMQGRAGMY
jgi:hypothetical protein